MPLSERKTGALRIIVEVANVKAGPAAFPDLNTINPKTRPSTLVRALAREEREHFETSRPEVRNTLALPAMSPLALIPQAAVNLEWGGSMVVNTLCVTH
jgi:hypothetical protein